MLAIPRKFSMSLFSLTAAISSENLRDLVGGGCDKCCILDDVAGFLFLNNLLSEVSSLADAIEQIAGDRETADRIRSKCDVINQTALQLSELRKNGKVKTHS